MPTSKVAYGSVVKILDVCYPDSKSQERSNAQKQAC